MTEFNAQDMDVNKQLGRIEEGIANIKIRLAEMASTWAVRVETRDKEKQAIEERLDMLEKHNAMIEGMAKPVKVVGVASVVAVVGLIAEFIARVIIR